MVDAADGQCRVVHIKKFQKDKASNAVGMGANSRYSK